MDSDTDTLAFGAEHEPKKLLRHPFVALLHILFRILSIVIYLFCGFSESGFIGSFIIIVLLVSIDFWVVKNITGRLLVGLRWWNYIDEEGKSHWVFESKKGDRQGRVLSMEAQIFWVGLVATPIIWVFLFIMALMKMNFKWIMIVVIALTLSGSNLYGYIRCKMGKSEGVAGSFKNFASGVLQRQMFANMTAYFSRAPPTADPSTTV